MAESTELFHSKLGASLSIVPPLPSVQQTFPLLVFSILNGLRIRADGRALSRLSAFRYLNYGTLVLETLPVPPLFFSDLSLLALFFASFFGAVLCGILSFRVFIRI
mmetsp:Transcript_7374/g.12657  ORF Transcript_7374/g.12657 Transcript_7374/m.12657 type:complete len:106 (-) Transcript_7374:289-606(-)